MNIILIIGLIISIIVIGLIAKYSYDKFPQNFKKEITNIFPENGIINLIIFLTLVLIIASAVSDGGRALSSILTQFNLGNLTEFISIGANLISSIARIILSGIYYICVVIIAMSLLKIANNYSKNPDNHQTKKI